MLFTEKNPNQALKKAVYRLSSYEVQLKKELENLYFDKGVEILLRQRLSNFCKSELSSSTKQGSRSFDGHIAAAVYLPTSGHILSFTVFHDEMSPPQLRLLKSICEASGILLFLLDKQDKYTKEDLARAYLSTKLEIDYSDRNRLILNAVCPNCGAPLIHKVMRPTERRDGLFYACPRWRGEFACDGFLIGAAELHELIQGDAFTIREQIMESLERAGDRSSDV